MRSVKLHKVSTHPTRSVKTNYDLIMERLNDPEVQDKIKKSRIITLTDIEHIKVQPAYQPDELAIEIVSKDGRKVHLLVKGHYA